MNQEISCTIMDRGTNGAFGVIVKHGAVKLRLSLDDARLLHHRLGAAIEGAVMATNNNRRGNFEK